MTRPESSRAESSTPGKGFSASWLHLLQRFRWWWIAIVGLMAGAATVGGAGQWVPVLGLPLLLASLPNPTALTTRQALSSVLIWWAALWYLVVWVALHLRYIVF